MVDVTRVLQMTFGAVLGLVSVFPSSDVPLLIRLLTLIAALLVVAHGADLLPKSGPKRRQEALQQVVTAFHLVLGVAMGIVCVLPSPDATMRLRVPALFVALVLVARASSPATWTPVRAVPAGATGATLDDVLGPEELPIGEDGSPVPFEPAAEPDPLVVGYPQTSPVVADRTRVAVPALLVSLAAWLGLALLAQRELSALGVLSFFAMFGLFTSGWRTLTVSAPA
ncbi:MAG: hypothetical protein U0Q15_18405 [Kineosporiaceae bacterium]